MVLCEPPGLGGAVTPLHDTTREGWRQIAGMERELSNLFAGRDVELRTPGDLSRYFRDEVRAEFGQSGWCVVPGFKGSTSSRELGRGLRRQLSSDRVPEGRHDN